MREHSSSAVKMWIYRRVASEVQSTWDNARCSADATPGDAEGGWQWQASSVKWLDVGGVQRATVSVQFESCQELSCVVHV